MEMNRVESFSDGVIAVIITIMVLEFKVPEDPSFAGLEKIYPQFLAYLYSFITVATIWGNHHHLLKGARRPDTALLWTNNNLLFWMSLVPFVTAYMAHHPQQPLPVALYGGTLAMMGLGFVFLRHAILRQRHANIRETPHLQRRLQLKNFVSAFAYFAGGCFAFVNVWISYAIYVGVLAVYFLPDASLALEHATAPSTAPGTTRE